MQIITEKYRPQTFDAIVPPKGLDIKFAKWKETNTIDSHLIFYGHAGTGKSTTAKAILRELDISDYKTLNGSDDTSVDTARELIEWASIPSAYGNQKICLIEEFERMSPSAQDSLKCVFEDKSNITIFILTTNNIKKITNPIISRCECFCFDNIDKNKYNERIAAVALSEGLFSSGDMSEDESRILTRIMDEHYPDFRGALNALNQNITIVDGKKTLFDGGNVDNSGLEDLVKEVLRCVKEEDVTAVQKAVFNIPKDNIGDCYRILYNHLDWITPVKEKWCVMLLTIQRYNIQHQTTVADQDMNFAACIVECYMLSA